MFTAALYNLKGGVGKTASCVNFAYMAAREGSRVLLWDLDPQGAASFYYNAEPKHKSSVKKLLANNLLMQDIIMDTGYEGLDIIPADTSARKLDILLNNNDSKKQLKNLLKEVAEDYDYVFFDCPPGFSILADNIFHASQAILMPVIPTTLSIRTYQQVKEHMDDKGEADKLHCFFTMADTRKALHNDIMKEMRTDNAFLQYYIPYLSDVEKMGVKNAPVGAFAPSSYAATCYNALWSEIKMTIG